MKVMVLMKASKDSEAGVMPSEQMLSAMMKFNEELVNAGVMLAGDGLHPSSRAKRVFLKAGAKPTVVDGPFSETKELIAGYWLWKVASLDEAAKWVLRMCELVDAPMGTEDAVVEIRQVFDSEDFGAELTPELRAKEDELRRRTGQA